MMPLKKSGAAMMRAARAPRHHLGVERRRDQAPFGGRIGMRDAAAERAAGADRMVRDVLHHVAKQRAERPFATGRSNAAWRTHGADAEPLALDREPAERRDAVDVDEMRGRASRNAMVGTRLCPPASTRPSSRRDSASSRDGFIDRLGRVIVKWRGLHRRSQHTAGSHALQCSVLRSPRERYMLRAPRNPTERRVDVRRYPDQAGRPGPAHHAQPAGPRQRRDRRHGARS